MEFVEMAIESSITTGMQIGNLVAAYNNIISQPRDTNSFRLDNELMYIEI